MKAKQKKLTLGKSTILVVGGRPIDDVLQCPTRTDCTQTCYNC